MDLGSVLINVFKFTNWKTNSVDPDQMASSEAIWSGSTLFAKVGVVLNSRIRVKGVYWQMDRQMTYGKWSQQLFLTFDSGELKIANSNLNDSFISFFSFFFLRQLVI